MLRAPALILPLCLVVLAGCENLGNPLDALSPKREGPDEFQVLARERLVLPGDRQSLPPPDPGAPSPREPDPRAQAVAALAGDPQALPGARGPAPSARISRGEAALLAAADARATDSAEAERLAARAAELEADAPYSPPTIFELFSSDTDVDPDLVLDPVPESERLQAAGVRAPADPTVEVTPPEPRTERAPGQYTRETPRGRPINRIDDVLEDGAPAE